MLDTGTEIDTLRGGAGYDTFYAGYGDHVDGGDGQGSLLISFQGATSGVTADFHLLYEDSRTMVIGGGTIANIRHVVWVDGSEFDDVISGSAFEEAGADIRGLGGKVRLIAGRYSVGL